TIDTADLGGKDEKEKEEEGGQSQAFNPETGEINWDCPCLGGMAQGTCGEQFKTAFSCFIYSEAEPKGMDCVDAFKAMQDCFRAHPEEYANEIGDDDEEEEKVEADENDTDIEDIEEAIVLLFGSGALGSVFAWRLQSTGAVEITAVCRSNYEAVRQHGFRIKSLAYGDHVYKPSRVVRSVEEAVGDAGSSYDYILVCTKALPNLGDNSGQIAAAVASGRTTIVLIQNGIGIEDPFLARYPDNEVLSVVAYIDVSQPEDG
ncbi:Oxidoreductase, partial [Coemansia sp. RSA 2681]